MINLNKEFLTKEKLMKYLTDYEVYSKYINQEIIVNKNIYSPFRSESNPSFGFFLGESGEICFHDFKLRLKGDCIRFVQILYNLTYYEALSMIAVDFDMAEDFYIKKVSRVRTLTDTSNENLNQSREKALSKVMYKFTLGKKRREWQPHDLLYWKDFGISLKTLKKYNVEPISHTIVNGFPIVADKYAYCFIELKDGIETYKIYQPFSEDYKWLNTHNESVWQGWDQLPISAEASTLIITKSLKDVMAIDENTDCYAVSLQSENVMPKNHVVAELKERFGTCMILYDNDFDKEENWGQILGKALSEAIGVFNIKIDSKHQSKDFSDLIKNKNVTRAVEIFDNELNSVPF